MDLELLAADAARASRVYLSDRIQSERWRCRRPCEGERRLWHRFGLFLLNSPHWLQDLVDVRLDFRRRRCHRELVEVELVLPLDDGDAERDSLVRPEVFPAGEDIVGCPGHGFESFGLTCVYKVV